MPMTVAPITLTIAGETIYGVAFSSEQERDAFLAGRGVPLDMPMATADRECKASGEPRPVGRPSFDSLIAEACATLGVQVWDARRPLAARARSVLRHLADLHDPKQIPGLATVKRYLNKNPLRKCDQK